MKHALFIAIGMIAVLVGLGLIMPAVALWRSMGSLTVPSAVGLLIGVVLAAGGVAAGLHPWLRRP